MLAIGGDTARAEGSARIDRLAWGIGTAHPDAGTVGLEVEMRVALTATCAGPADPGRLSKP